MQEAAQDFFDLYDLVQHSTRNILESIHEIRGPAMGLFQQIHETIASAQARFSAQWLNYYTEPLVINRSAFSRLDVDFLTMCANWTYDESYPDGLPFAFCFNAILIGILALCLTLLQRAGLLLLHGDASPLLVLLIHGTAIVLPLLSLTLRKENTGPATRWN